MKKHIILTLGRSGSNYLANLLNKHPKITNYGEVLGEWTIPYKIYTKMRLGHISTEKYLDFVYSSRFFFYAAHAYSAISHLRKGGKELNFEYYGDIETIGIKDFSFNFKRRGISSYLKERRDIFVINLYRENILKRFISLEKMRLSGVAKLTGSGQGEKADHARKIKLDIPYTLSQLEKFDQRLSEHQSLVQELPQELVLNICYEHVFVDQNSMSHCKQEVFDFLGVQPIAAKSEHRKILSDKLEDVIENFDEIVVALHETRFARYLD